MRRRLTPGAGQVRFQKGAHNITVHLSQDPSGQMSRIAGLMA